MVADCVGEEMLLFCVWCVIGGWIWIRQWLSDVAGDVNGAVVGDVNGAVMPDIYDVVLWICAVICDVGRSVSSASPGGGSVLLACGARSCMVELEL